MTMHTHTHTQTHTHTHAIQTVGVKDSIARLKCSGNRNVFEYVFLKKERVILVKYLTSLVGQVVPHGRTKAGEGIKAMRNVRV